MLPVSDDYKIQMQQPDRPRAFARISYYFVSVEAQEKATFNANQSQNYSLFSCSPQALLDDKEPKSSYATFEDNLLSTASDNRYIIFDTFDTCTDKVVSNDVCGENRTFSKPPTIVFDLPKPLSIQGISLVFDSIGGNYATEFDVMFISKDDKKQITVTDCTSYEYETEKISMDNVKTVRLAIRRWSKPHQRARLNSLLFGTKMVISNDQLADSGMTHDRYVDLLSVSLSHNELSFSIHNINGDYNALNPTGKWRFVEPDQKVTVEYGRQIDRSIEWLKADTLFLDGDIQVTDKTVTFKAIDALSKMQGEVYGAKWQDYYVPLHASKDRPIATPFFAAKWVGISLYKLAKSILDYYNDNYKKVKYVLDPCLEEIVTYKCLGEMDVKNALQLIANAGHCILYADEDGVITFKNALNPKITINASNNCPISNINSAYNESRLPDQAYVLFEENYFSTASNTLIVADDDYQHLSRVGYISSIISDKNGGFSNKPVITIDYSIAVSLYALPITFDNVMGGYATNFTIDIYLANKIIHTEKIKNNKKVSYSFIKKIAKMDKVVITIESWSKAYQRCIINGISGGRVNDFYLDFNSAMQKPIVTNSEKIKQIDVSFYDNATKTDDLFDDPDKLPELKFECIKLENGIAYYKTTHEPINMIADMVIDGGDEINGNGVIPGTEEFYTASTKFCVKWELNTPPPTPVTNLYKQELAEHIASIQFNDKGITKSFKNELITNKEHAELIARWLYDYIAKTSSLKVNYRGNPEVVPFDTIYIQSSFEDYSVSCVQSNKITFDGGMNGEMEVIKI